MLNLYVVKRLAVDKIIQVTIIIVEFSLCHWWLGGVKNLPAVQETWVLPLDREDPLEKE